MQSTGTTAGGWEIRGRMTWGSGAPGALGRDARAQSATAPVTYLDRDNLAAWLDARGLLGARRVADVSLLSARAFAALVTLDDGSALFLKQPVEAIPPVGAVREGRLLRLVAECEALRTLRTVLPRLVHYDETDTVTVTAGHRTHRTLHAIGVPPACDAPVREAAVLLAAVHIASARPAAREAGAASFGAVNPVPDFDRVTPEEFANAPGNGFGVFLSNIQALREPLRELQRAWAPVCLIHGDFRDDNVMIAPVALANEPRIVFVDWELGGWGDPLWDLGAFVGQYLYYWVESIKPSAGTDFAAWVREAGIPFAAVQRTVRTFLSSYSRAAGRPLSGPDGILTRVVQLAGVFLLHRVLGSLESVGHIHAAAFSSLQVGRMLISQPERAKRIIAKDLV